MSGAASPTNEGRAFCQSRRRPLYRRRGTLPELVCCIVIAHYEPAAWSKLDGPTTRYIYCSASRGMWEARRPWRSRPRSCSSNRGGSVNELKGYTGRGKSDELNGKLRIASPSPSRTLLEDEKRGRNIKGAASGATKCSRPWRRSSLILYKSTRDDVLLDDAPT